LALTADIIAKIEQRNSEKALFWGDFRQNLQKPPILTA